MDTLNKEFASLHGISTTLNFVALGGLAFHGMVRRSFCFLFLSLLLLLLALSPLDLALGFTDDDGCRGTPFWELRCKGRQTMRSLILRRFFSGRTCYAAGVPG